MNYERKYNLNPLKFDKPIWNNLYTKSIKRTKEIVTQFVELTTECAYTFISNGVAPFYKKSSAIL